MLGKTSMLYLPTYFSKPAYPWGIAGATARIVVSKHLDPLQQGMLWRDVFPN